MPQADSLLSAVFGFDRFRPGQAEIVDTVARGQDTLVIMPTGGGKSICFQLPALMRDGVTLVISPLIALMRDQVRALREAGVEAGALTSGNTPEETDAVMAALGKGRLKLLYMAPERLASGATLPMLRRAGVALIAGGEAHCVSQWGHDFRPDYLRIGAVRKALGVPLAAFTATADAETRDEIVARLFDSKPPQSFIHGFDRPNIRLAFEPKNQPRKQIMAFADARPGQAGIVYCGTRAKTETLARALAEDGHQTAAYHGGMESDLRRKVEERFQREDGLIVVATVAFGMGIDKPDIRWVAHADLPKSVEAYYQEIGRAGRDGAPADTLTLYGADDIRFRRQQIDESLAPPERRSADHGRLNALLGLAEALGCRRRQLLAYFGEDSEPCGNCDLCENPPQTFDGTVAVQKALSAILRTGESFGATYLVDILLGQSNDRILRMGHDRLPTFGVGAELGRTEWQAVFRQMMGRDLVRPDPERHGALRLMPEARAVLRGEEPVTLRRDLARALATKRQARPLVHDEDAPLLATLKAKRRELAEAARVPAYVIFADRTLIEMAEKRPATLDQMARIGGVGEKKLERYGATFLQAITGAQHNLPHPKRRKLAGRQSGSVYDRLVEVQDELRHGRCGTLKPVTCSASLLARVAQMHGADRIALARLLGDRRAERFAEAFAEVLAKSD